MALVPASSGTFEIAVYLPSLPFAPVIEGDDEKAGNQLIGKGKDEANVREHMVWNRKTDEGFPETKGLKRRVRDLVDAQRGLGHVDRDYRKKDLEAEEGLGKKVFQKDDSAEKKEQEKEDVREEGKEGCEDCK